MVDDPAATDEEGENKKSGSGGETAQAVADIALVVAGPRPSTSVPSAGSAGGSTETAAATAAAVDVAAAGDAADAADGAVSVAGSVLGILDGL